MAKTGGLINRKLRRLLKSGLVALAGMGAVLLLGPVAADERPTQTRIDLYDAHSNQTGHAIIEDPSGRIEFYDRQSRRTGSGTIGPSGRVDLFDRSGKRTGYGQVAPGVPDPDTGTTRR